MLTNEILSSIDNIDECVMEAEMNVLTAMCNEYDKAIMIMENYNGNDYSSFDIFQESVIMEDGEEPNNSNVGSDNNQTTQNLQSRKNGILSRIIQSFRNMITKISMKIIGVKFDGVIKRIEKAPDGAKFILRGAMLKQPIEDLYNAVDATVDHIDWLSGIINDNTITSTSSGEWNIDKDKYTDDHKKSKEYINRIKTLLETEELDGRSEVYLKENLLDIAKKEKGYFDDTCAKIRDMLKNMNKAFKNMRFTENSASNSVQLIKNDINDTIKEYLTIMKVLIKRMNMYNEGTISDGNNTDNGSGIPTDTVKCPSNSELTSPYLAKLCKDEDPENKCEKLLVSYECLSDTYDDAVKAVIDYFSNKYNKGDKVVVICILAPEGSRVTKIKCVEYEYMEDKLRVNFKTNDGYIILKG